MSENVYNEIIKEVESNFDIKSLNQMVKSIFNNEQEQAFNQIKICANEIVKQHLSKMNKEEINSLVNEINLFKVDNLKNVLNSTYGEDGFVFTLTTIEYEVCRSINQLSKIMLEEKNKNNLTSNSHKKNIFQKLFSRKKEDIEEMK